MSIKSAGLSAATFLAVLGFQDSARASAVVVDWLDLATGSTASSFTLTSDLGIPVASGALAIENGKGQAFSGFPTAGSLNAGFWSGATGYQDSVTGDERVGIFDIRVVPQGGMAAYSLTLGVPAGRDLIVAVGGLFRSGTAATAAIVTSVSGGGVISFIRSLAWDNGGTAYDQELEWDGPTGSLSTTTGADGDSEMAFLRISSLSGPNPKLTFLVPDGYGSGAGDSISIGIGTVIPEPGVLGLAALGAVVCLAGRRREKSAPTR